MTDLNAQKPEHFLDAIFQQGHLFLTCGLQQGLILIIKIQNDSTLLSFFSFTSISHTPKTDCWDIKLLNVKVPGTSSCLLINHTLKMFCKSVNIGDATAIPDQVNGQCFLLLHSLQGSCIVDSLVVLPHTGRFLVSKSLCPVDFETNSLNPNGKEPVTIVGYVLVVVTEC